MTLTSLSSLLCLSDDEDDSWLLLSSNKGDYSPPESRIQSLYVGGRGRATVIWVKEGPCFGSSQHSFSYSSEAHSAVLSSKCIPSFLCL